MAHKQPARRRSELVSPRRLVNDGEAMKRFGGTMVAWDVKAMQPQKVFNVPGEPLEIRWSLNEGDNWAVDDRSRP